MRTLVSPKSHAPLFDRTTDGRAFVPTTSPVAAARSAGPGRPPGRRERALPWTGVSPAARSPVIGTSVLLLALSWPLGATAQTPNRDLDLATTISDAAQRFGLPERWIRAVMGVESAYQPHAVSRAGAIGLMQVMPATYAGLRVRYGLGPDPFHPHDNVVAGAAYLREMFDRFGANGFLAAYNAGPARYLQHVAEGRPLPLETRAYVARLAPAVQGEEALAGAEIAPRVRIAPSPPSLFVALSSRPKGEPTTDAAPPDAAHAPIFARVSGAAP